jgi:hypothetical protein
MKTFVVLAGLWAAVYVATCPALLGGILRPKIAAPMSGDLTGTFGSASTPPIITFMSGDQLGPIGSSTVHVGTPTRGGVLMWTGAGFVWVSP